jgi:hypothetical protein
MPPTITRINPQGGAPDFYHDEMQVTKSDGTKVNIDIDHYIKFQKPDGTVVYGRVYSFSAYTDPDSFSYTTGPNESKSLKTPTNNSELDTIENLGSQRPPQMGGRRKNRSGTKKARRNRRRSTRRSSLRNFS